MCGRYILVQKTQVLEKRFNALFEQPDDYKPSHNISPGQYAAVITDAEPHKIQLFRFGLIPFWSKTKTAYINARAEGDNNSTNDPMYRGAKGIINKPAFRKPIRSQRCLVIADAFIEGTTAEGLDKPYVVYLPGNRPFCFAGIWDKWKNPETEEEIRSFAIITTTPNELLQKIPHHRSPVILSQYHEQRWVRERTSLSGATQLLKPFPADQMNAYPLGPAIKDPKNNALEYIQPIGERLQPEYDIRTTQVLKLQGMGHYKSKKRDDDTPPLKDGELPPWARNI